MKDESKDMVAFSLAGLLFSGLCSITFINLFLSEPNQIPFSFLNIFSYMIIEGFTIYVGIIMYQDHKDSLNQK